MEIAGKVAMVTGAGSGIGRASAKALAAAGAAVVVVDIDRPGGEETVQLIEAAGGRATFVEADVATPEGVRAMFAAAEERYGGVDIVHNNAGIVSGGRPGWPWPHTPLERIMRVITTNLGGAVMGTRAAIDALVKRGGGVVVNTTSLAALGPGPFDPPMVATKAGIVLFTQSCKGLKESHNVRVNTVLPGLVDTPILGQLGDGSGVPDWGVSALAGIELLKAERVAEVVLELIRDDELTGEARILPNPPKAGAVGAAGAAASQRSTASTN